MNKKQCQRVKQRLDVIRRRLEDVCDEFNPDDDDVLAELIIETSILIDDSIRHVAQKIEDFQYDEWASQQTQIHIYNFPDNDEELVITHLRGKKLA